MNKWTLSSTCRRNQCVTHWRCQLLHVKPFMKEKVLLVCQWRSEFISRIEICRGYETKCLTGEKRTWCRRNTVKSINVLRILLDFPVSALPLFFLLLENSACQSRLSFQKWLIVPSVNWSLITQIRFFPKARFELCFSTTFKTFQFCHSVSSYYLCLCAFFK